ncbi:protein DETOXIFICATION 45 [Citrus sinensis]|nr:protein DETOXIFICATION 45 [Citrus sinensis]
MAVNQFIGGRSCGITGTSFQRRAINKMGKAFPIYSMVIAPPNCSFGVINRAKNGFNPAIMCCGSVSDQHASDYITINPSGVGERLASDGGELSNESRKSAATSQSCVQNVQLDLIMLSLPAIAGQAIEPMAQLMETAYIGRLGPLELASAGVSTSIFNILSKVFNIPLLSVATSFVAEDISRSSSKDSTSDSSCPNVSYNGCDESTDRKLLPSVSTALVLALTIGILEALAMYFGSGLFLDIMGISSASSMRIPAQRFLSLRAIGAPAVVLSLAIQGIFRGFKDTRTPVFCLGLGNFSAVFMFPMLMYYFKLGVTGAAISTVGSQYMVTLLMIWYLNKRTILSIPNMKNLHFGDYLRSGGYLLGRTLAAVMTITLSTSIAARQGALAMAAHQICLQVWLSVSMLADAQAASGQALIASSFAKGDYNTVKEITHFALKTGLFTGVTLAVILGASFNYLATLFTSDTQVLGIVRSGLLFVSASQPVTAVAYIFDGLHYGVSDFSYAAYSMMAVGAISSVFLLYAPRVFGLSAVWWGLTLFMSLRVVAGYFRLLSKNGPWWFLQKHMPKLEVCIM